MCRARRTLCTKRSRAMSRFSWRGKVVTAMSAQAAIIAANRAGRGRAIRRAYHVVYALPTEPASFPPFVKIQVA